MAALLSVKWQPSVTSADNNFFHFLFLVLCYLVSRTAWTISLPTGGGSCSQEEGKLKEGWSRVLGQTGLNFFCFWSEMTLWPLSNRKSVSMQPVSSSFSVLSRPSSSIPYRWIFPKFSTRDSFLFLRHSSFPILCQQFSGAWGDF